MYCLKTFCEPTICSLLHGIFVCALWYRESNCPDLHLGSPGTQGVPSGTRTLLGNAPLTSFRCEPITLQLLQFGLELSPANCFSTAQRTNSVSKNSCAALCRENILGLGIFIWIAWNGVKNVKPWIVFSAIGFLGLPCLGRSREGLLWRRQRLVKLDQLLAQPHGKCALCSWLSPFKMPVTHLCSNEGNSQPSLYREGSAPCQRAGIANPFAACLPICWGI